MGTPKDSERTRARIIEAAGQLFAEKGFKAVTVREIVAAAETHLSALNYHFKGKEALYKAVVENACCSVALTSATQAYLLSLDPRESLVTYVREAAGSGKRDALDWRLALVSRVVTSPDELSAREVEQFFISEMTFLAKLVSRAIGEEEGSDRALFGVLSLFGLIDSFYFYGGYASKVAPEFVERSKDADWLANHIVTLVCSGIAATDI